LAQGVSPGIRGVGGIFFCSRLGRARRLTGYSPPPPALSPGERVSRSGLSGRVRGPFPRLTLHPPAHGSRRGPHPFAPPGLAPCTHRTERDVCATREAGVACLSGTAFGDWGEGYLRFSYANSVENIQKALERVENWVRKNL